jgi:hypothetical protein
MKPRVALVRCIAAVAVFFGALVPFASPAHAQGIARTFEQLEVLVRPGDKVSVTDASGTEVTGRIVNLSTSAITLTLSGREQREWAEHEVTRIRQRRGDSLGNGAVLGLAIGGGLSAAMVAAYWEPGDNAGEAAVVIAIYAGIGAAIGTGVDAMIVRKTLIYQPRTTARLSVGPLVSQGRRGAAVSWRF